MKNENLEIIISVTEVVEDDFNAERSAKKFEDELKDISKDYKIIESDIGPGADWVVIIAILSGLFFLGKKINENLDAWVSLARKFKKLLNRFKKEKYFIDSNGATLIAINEIIETEKNLGSLEEIHSIELSKSPIKRYFRDDRPDERIDSKPYRYFIKVFLVNDNLFYIFEIKSDGTIKNVSKFSDDHYEFFNF